MNERATWDEYRGCSLHPAGPARSACGGQAPTSPGMAHSRSPAGPSDPAALRPFAADQNRHCVQAVMTCLRDQESLTQNSQNIFQLNSVPRHISLPDNHTRSGSNSLSKKRNTQDLPLSG
jgi:hypothetical protein